MRQASQVLVGSFNRRCGRHFAARPSGAKPWRQRVGDLSLCIFARHRDSDGAACSQDCFLTTAHAVHTRREYSHSCVCGILCQQAVCKQGDTDHMCDQVYLGMVDLQGQPRALLRSSDARLARAADAAASL